MAVFGVVRVGHGRVLVLVVSLAVALAAGAAGLGAPVRPAIAPRQEAHTVYLTFDDGPSANTTALLEALAEYGIRATFFVTGQYEGDTAALLQSIAAAGHSIGLHSYSHDYDAIYSYSEAFWADLGQMDALVAEATGQTARLYRFPGGSQNTHCPRWLRQELRAELEQRGYVYFDWNVVSGDQGSRLLSAEELFENVVAGAARVEQGPLMVLFHDTNHCKTTPEAVRLVVEHFLEEGWQFRPITEETAPIHF